jgi:hypothetical protein
MGLDKVSNDSTGVCIIAPLQNHKNGLMSKLTRFEISTFFSVQTDPIMIDEGGKLLRAAAFPDISCTQVGCFSPGGNQENNKEN